MAKNDARERRAGGLPVWLLLLSVIVCVVGLRYVLATSFTVPRTDGGEQRVFMLWDDGMISMTYAHNLALGHGLVWNPGEPPVQGYSNLGVTLLMALLHLLPVDRFTVSLMFQLLNVAVVAVCPWLAWRLASAMSGKERLPGIMAAVGVAAYAPLAVWSLQGSDVGIVTLIALGAVTLVAEREARARRAYGEPGAVPTRSGAAWPSAVFPLLALGVVVRYDTVIVYLVVLAHAVMTGARREAMRGFLLLGGLAIALLAFGWLYYGDPLPNTYYLKATGMPRRDMVWRGLASLWSMAGPVGAALLLFAAAGVIALRRRADVVLVASIVFVLLAYNTWIGDDWITMVHGRFVVPAVVLHIVLCAVLAEAAWRRFASARPATGVAPRAGLALLALAGLLTFFPAGAIQEFWDLHDGTMFRAVNRTNVRLGLFLEEVTEPGTTVAYNWAGAPRYFSDRPGVDMLGRNDRHIARLTVDSFNPGHSKWDWEYVFAERQPEVVLDATSTTGVLESDPHLSRYYWLVRSPRKPDGLPFAVRKDATGILRGQDFEFFSLPDLEPVPATSR